MSQRIRTSKQLLLISLLAHAASAVEDSETCATLPSGCGAGNRESELDALVQTKSFQSSNKGGLLTKPSRVADVVEDVYGNDEVGENSEDESEKDEASSGTTDESEYGSVDIGADDGDENDVDDDADESSDGNSESNCLDFTTQSDCQSNGCAWSKAFDGDAVDYGGDVGEINQTVEGFKCADDDEVVIEEQAKAHTLDENVTAIQLHAHEMVIESTRKGCSRRREDRRRGGCPWARRRRASQTLGSDGCPDGFDVFTTGKCTGSGKCCRAGWSAQCGQSCAKERCTATGGTWVALDYYSNPYTCDMPPAGCFALGKSYSPTNMGGQSRSVEGSASGCQQRCGSVSGCAYFSWWIDGGCHLQSSSATQSSTDNVVAGPRSCQAPTPAPTPAVPATTPDGNQAAKTVFDIIDGDHSNNIDEAELQNALDTGVVSAGTNGAPSAPQVPNMPSQAQQNAIVEKHNALRGGLGASDMTMMKWDSTLATAAAQFVSDCPSGHSDNRANSVGENIAWKWSSNFQLTDTTDLTPGIQDWYDEIDHAGTYRNGGTFEGFGKCSGVCGHYTQVVWAAADSIGCGVKSCPHPTGMAGYELVCQYGTSIPGSYGGNMQSATLFTKGAPCSSCPSGFNQCSNGLCSK